MAFSFRNEYPVLGDNVSEREPEVFTIFGAPPVAGSTTVFIADRPYIVVSVQEIHPVASTGGASTLGITKDTGTGAPGSGSSVLAGAATFNLAGTANTLQTLQGIQSGLAQLAVGDRLALVATGTLTSMTSYTVNISLRSTSIN
jgi:hypothetical protein